MERREVIRVCSGVLAGAPLAWLKREPSSDEPKEGDFYRILEDARMAYCWHEWQRAYVLYGQALRVLPAKADTSLLAEILEDRKSLARALGEHREGLPRHLAAVKAQPEDAEQRFWLGSTWLRLGHLPEAAEQFRAALGLPESAWQIGSWLDLGWIHYRHGDYDDAISCFNRVCKMEEEEDKMLAFLQRLDREKAQGHKILALAAAARKSEAEAAIREYVVRFGRLPWAERRILRRHGIDADAWYIAAGKCCRAA